MTGLSLRGVTVLRGKRLVLEDVSFTAPSGAITAVLGAPGAGKTSLLAAAGGLLKLSRGAVLQGGADVTRLAPRRRGIGLLAPGSTLPDAMTVRDALRRLAGRDAAPLLDAIADQLGLAAFLPAEAGTLSHGQAQLALAAARLARAGTTLLVDEAAAGLDDASAASLLAILRQRSAAGATILLATRAYRTALAADHLVLLGAGRVLQTGTPASLYAEPRDASCATLTGPANILQGQIRELRPGGFAWSCGGRFVQSAGHHTPRPALGGKVSLCLRPERIALLEPGASADNEQHGPVTEMAFAGAALMVRVAAPLGDVLLSCPAWPGVAWPTRGQQVRIGWPAGAAHVLDGA